MEKYRPLTKLGFLSTVGKPNNDTLDVTDQVDVERINIQVDLPPGVNVYAQRFQVDTKYGRALASEGDFVIYQHGQLLATATREIFQKFFTKAI